MRSVSLFFWRSILLLACCAGLGAVIFEAHAGPDDSTTPADPIPLRRLLIGPERVPAELAKVADGVLKKLSYKEFQAKIAAAVDAGEALKNPPRLTQTTYSATLKGTALEGNGEWKISNPRKAGILPLPDLSLALKKEDRIQLTRGPTDAILGDLDGKSLGLLLSKPGPDSLVFAWTAQGETDPDGRLRFKLSVPPCPIASLELTLPASSLVRLLSPGRAFVSRSEKEGVGEAHSRWVVRFSGQAEIELLIHRTNGSAPLVLARLETEQILSPGRVQAKFRYRVEVLHNVVRKLYFECDRRLAPTNVSIPNTDLRWTVHDVDNQRLLVIELLEPKLNPEQPLPLLTVSCLAPLALNGRWTSPGLRLVKALPWGKSVPNERESGAPLADARLVSTLARGEALTLKLHPEVQLEDWSNESFRLVRSEIAGDRSRVLSLAGNDGPRPSAEARAPGLACLARQYTWWQVGARDAVLTSHIQFEIGRGRLFQLRLAIPAGWEVDQLKAGPDDRLVRSWAPLVGKDHTIVIVDLDRAVQPQAPVQLTIRLRAPPHFLRSLTAPFPFPDVEPLDARFRAGAFAISVNRLYRAEVLNTSATSTAPEEPQGVKAPWQGQPIGFYFPFRVQATALDQPDSEFHRPAVTGSLLLRPRKARVRATCTTDVTLVADRAAVDVRLHIQADRGSPRHVDYYISAPLTGSPRWKTIGGTNYVREVVPFLPELLCLNGGQPLSTAGAFVQPSEGRWWRLVLARPLTEPLTLRTTVDLAGRGPRVPLVSMGAGDALDGEVSLYLAGADVADVKTSGLRSSVARSRGGEAEDAPSAVLTYRYASIPSSVSLAGARPSLAFVRRPGEAGQSSRRVIEQCRLTTYVETLGRMRHYFSFQLSSWHGRTFSIRLPPGTTLQAAKAYGRWIALPARMETEEGLLVKLEVASGAGPHRFEIVYAPPESDATGAFWTRLAAPAPLLPVEPLMFQRTWRLAPGLCPLFEGALRRLPAPDPDRGFPSFESLRRSLTATSGLGSEGSKSALLTQEKPSSQLTPGQDSSGRFRTAIDWLGEKAWGHHPPQAPSSLDLDGGETQGGWTAWEPVAGVDGEDEIWVIRERVPAVLGLTLSIALLILALRARRKLSRAWRVRLLMVWLGASGTALIWLPPSLRDLAWWSGLGAAALALFSYVLSTVRSQHARAPGPSAPSGEYSRPAAQVTGAILGVLLMACAVGEAAAPAPPTVLLIKDPKGREKLYALITPQLDALLDRLAQRGMKALRGAVLLSADYRGTVHEGHVDFEADFQVYCFSKEATLEMPLGNVVLKARGPLGEPALFAGKPAYPVALSGGRAGYAVPAQVENPDIYTLEMRFTVPLSRNEAERKVQMEVPRLVQSRLVLDFPARVRPAGAAVGMKLPAAAPKGAVPESLQIRTALGTQRAAAGARRVEANLGRVARVEAQWREPGPKMTPAVQVQEMHLWDLRTADVSLSSLLQYTIGKGSVSRIALGLPDGMEARSVEVGGGAFPEGGTPAGLLKGWSVGGTGAARELVVNLDRPVTGKLVLVLELIPRMTPEHGPWTLALPIPPKNVKTLPGYLAYRIDGSGSPLETTHLGVTAIKPAAFAQRWRQAVRKTSDTETSTQAYSFMRASRGPASLRIALAPAPLQAEQEVLVRARLDQADVTARATITAPAGNLMLIEWDAPGVTVSKVSGPEVWDWAQAGSRVQIWLKRACARATIELGGWAPLARLAPGHWKLSVPAFRFPGASGQQTLLGLDAAAGSTLEQRRVRNLVATESPPAEGLLAGCQRAYESRQPAYEADFDVRTASAQVRIFTLAEMRKQELVITSILEYEMTRAGLKTLRVRLRGWSGDKVALEAPEALRIVESKLERSETVWNIDLPKGVGRHYRVKLSGKVPLDPGALAMMPEISDASIIGGGGSVAAQERWIAIVGPGLAAVSTSGLLSVKSVPATHPMWKALPLEDLRRVRDAWAIEGTRWLLQLQAKPPAGSRKAHVLLDEQSAAVVDGRRWLHRAAYRLYTDGPLGLQCVLPDGAVPLAMDVDGEPQPMREAGSAPIQVSLDTGPHVLSLTWRFPSARESLDRPDLARPKLVAGEAFAETSPIWLVQMPPGYRVVPDTTGAPGRPLNDGDAELRRAAAEQRLLTLLAESGADLEREPVHGQLVAAQERFSWYWRRAQYRLERAGMLARRSSRASTPSVGQLDNLCRLNDELSTRPALKLIRVEADKHTRNGVFPPRGWSASTKRLEDNGAGLFQIDQPQEGTPTFWEVDGGADRPHLQLSMGAVEATEHALAGTAVLMLALLGAWGMSFAPHVYAALQKAWPEQIILLGWLLWQLAGMSAVGMAVMALGGLARLYPLGRWVFSFFPPMSPNDSPHPGSASSM